MSTTKVERPLYIIYDVLLQTIYNTLKPIYKYNKNNPYILIIYII
jgi:hypothetical protein